MRLPFGLSLSKPRPELVEGPAMQALRHGALLRQAQDVREYKLGPLLRVNG